MVYLLAGPKGTGKTQQMIEQANEAAKKCNGNVVFIKKTKTESLQNYLQIQQEWQNTNQDLDMAKKQKSI